MLYTIISEYDILYAPQNPDFAEKNQAVLSTNPSDFLKATNPAEFYRAGFPLRGYRGAIYKNNYARNLL